MAVYSTGESIFGVLTFNRNLINSGIYNVAGTLLQDQSPLQELIAPLSDTPLELELESQQDTYSEGFGGEGNNYTYSVKNRFADIDVVSQTTYFESESQEFGTTQVATNFDGVFIRAFDSYSSDNGLLLTHTYYGPENTELGESDAINSFLLFNPPGQPPSLIQIYELNNPINDTDRFVNGLSSLQEMPEKFEPVLGSSIESARFVSQESPIYQKAAISALPQDTSDYILMSALPL